MKVEPTGFGDGLDENYERKRRLYDIKTGRLVYHFLIREKPWADQFRRGRARVCLKYFKLEVYKRNIIGQDRLDEDAEPIIPQYH